MHGNRDAERSLRGVAADQSQLELAGKRGKPIGEFT